MHGRRRGCEGGDFGGAGIDGGGAAAMGDGGVYLGVGGIDGAVVADTGNGRGFDNEGAENFAANMDDAMAAV